MKDGKSGEVKWLRCHKALGADYGANKFISVTSSKRC